MSSVDAAERPVAVHVENIGGIDETDVELRPGVSVLAGRNATNRTSFLRSIMAALGSERVSLKGDAEEGHVELTIGEESYTRRLARSNGVVSFDGEPYLADPELADLFAFLLESNEARRAVEVGGDLRELLLRPIDTERIDEEIDRLRSERERVDERLSELSTLEREIPELEAERQRLDEAVDEATERLEEARAALDAATDEDTDTDEDLEELRELRRRLEDLEYERETERRSLDSLEAEREELGAELAELPGDEESALDEMASRIETLRGRKRELDETVSRLQTIVQFNQEIVEGERPSFVRQIDGERPVTDRLVEDEELTCWTCGSTVESAEMEAMLDRLRELRSETAERRREVTDELDELRARRESRAERRRERERLDREAEETDREIERREERLAEVDSEIEELETEIEELEVALEARDGDETFTLQREVTEAEFELRRVESEREAVAEEIEEVEERLSDRETLENQRESIREEIERLRTRIDRIERDAIEAFNEHMGTVLDLLDYANLERIWIERREAASPREDAEYLLHVTRSTDGGIAYEDEVEHLSESEREVTGLIVALAGALAHDVAEEVPFLLLDSLEAIDSERIATLVEYFDEHVPYIVVALLPEDAAALDDDYRRITDV
ncbi:archaea-specific SMC-related protein [Natronorarus salvus]|uniref:archaea-specific SMC-related protein n=1 Tax=Natronorarus salvus TaxID=3117733 RepID=UPI002F26CF23